MPELPFLDPTKHEIDNFKKLHQLFTNKNSLDPATAVEFINLLGNSTTPKEQIIELTQLWKNKPQTPQDLELIAKEILQRINTLETEFEIYDCCGTGGDKSSSFNISTASAFVAASLGLKIAKHGGRKTSSQSGSIDFLQALGISSSTSLLQTKNLLDKYNLAFIASPATHEILGRWKEICCELEFFGQTGLIGTLTNPVKTSCQILGVAKPEWGPLMIESLKLLGRKSALVLCGEISSKNSPINFIDEASINGQTHCWLLSKKKIHYFVINPQEIGSDNNYQLEDLTGGSAKENAEIFLQILKPQNSHVAIETHSKANLTAIQEAVTLSSALLLTVEASSLKDLSQKNTFITEFKAQLNRVKQAFATGSILAFYEDFKSYNSISQT